MHLYVMRHAEAEKLGGAILSDRERPLTAYGRLQAETMAQELKRRTVCPLIACSPYQRTVQTAAILAKVLSGGVFHQEPRLASAGQAPDLPALLALYPQANELLLLGHQPDLGMLAAKLLGFEFGFSPATVAAFESNPTPAWTFRWTVTPEQLFKK